MARALTDVTSLTVRLQYMDTWLSQYKSWHFLRTIDEIAFKYMDERLEFFLKRQVKQSGRHVKLTHQEIVSDLNSSREVISRLMKKMEKNGSIVIHRNSFEWIKD